MLVPPQIPLVKGKPTRQNRIDAIAKMADKLSDEALPSLQDFAQFLAEKYPQEAALDLEIQVIERPADENVIKAIKRLSKTYPMLDKQVLFEQTSAAMSAHILQEVSAKDSIDRLEKTFAEAYQALKSSVEKNTSKE